MLEEYEFILSLKLLEFEIRQITAYTSAFPKCYTMLKNKLDDLCDFIYKEENVQNWPLWQSNTEVQELSRNVRETSINALRVLEKYQAEHGEKDEIQQSKYMDLLSDSVRSELACLQIDQHSKVLIIGSGAFPVSVLTIAQVSGAEVVGQDLDEEAVELAKQSAAMSDRVNRVTFTHRPLNELAFAQEATHVIVASHVADKQEVLEDLRQLASYHVKILIRYGNGLKSLFNYTWPEGNHLPGWTQSPVSTASQLYDTVILEKVMQMKKV
ncbi:class I SAM-dependent methyltransferase [Paenibacillus chondroitinus]|uniref:Class I SAM-dependent methyltransferase n=1 Tax=Paenibacillus chondroitinus TaxID=59842 RepID=A0ABU6DAN0_9BACL|nr:MULTISPECIES: class I SAM-dependent methyltransferase [Paenibacillus]MCY9659808.1 methyltransferase domain-containing protein [Paenibacillus anseongense]MEB4794013.1 class I SAM-dependent methyltransferase [Paenibacillus chondroitinus]